MLAEGGGWDFGRLLDLDMMLLFGGQERTARQWQRLLADCGFEIDGGLPAAGWAVLTCRPAATAATAAAAGRASSGQARR